MRFRLPSPTRPLRLDLGNLSLVSPRVLCGSLLLAAVAALGAVGAGQVVAFVPQKAIEGPLYPCQFCQGYNGLF
jgi:hypothetical protein